VLLLAAAAALLASAQQCSGGGKEPAGEIAATDFVELTSTSTCMDPCPSAGTCRAAAPFEIRLVVPFVS